MGLSGRLLAGVERSVAPLDVLRRALYRAFVPWLGPWIRDRDVRVGIHGFVVVVGSWLGALIAPLWLLALGPLLLGVPHLVADLRYLVARPGLHLRRGAVVVGVLVLLSSVMVDLRFGLVGAALAPLGARCSWPRRLAVATPLAVLALASFWGLRETTVALGHVHNLIAVVLWLLLSATLGAARLGPTLAFGLGGALILGGVCDPLLSEAPSYHVRSLAPGLDPVWATRWVVTFAYAQAVHYGLWLRVIPEEGRDRPSPRSWKASLRALRADLGEPLLAFAVLLTLAIAVWGLVDLTEARAGYLRLALFHGPLELAVLGIVAAEGRKVLRP